MKKLFKQNSEIYRQDYCDRNSLDWKVKNTIEQYVYCIENKFGLLDEREDETVELDIQSYCNRDCKLSTLNVVKNKDITVTFVDETGNKEDQSLKDLCINDLINILYKLIEIQENETDSKQN